MPSSGRFKPSTVTWPCSAPIPRRSASSISTWVSCLQQKLRCQGAASVGVASRYGGTPTCSGTAPFGLEPLARDGVLLDLLARPPGRPQRLGIEQRQLVGDVRGTRA